MPSRFRAFFGVFNGIFGSQIASGIVLGGIGLTGAWKMGMTSNKGQINPLRWDWKDPDTAFEVFSGFAMFSGTLVDICPIS